MFLKHALQLYTCLVLVRAILCIVLCAKWFVLFVFVEAEITLRVLLF